MSAAFDFPARLSLPRVVWGDVENPFIASLPVFRSSMQQMLLQEWCTTEAPEDAPTGGVTWRFKTAQFHAKVTVLSTRAGNWPKQLLWSHFNVNFYKKLKIIRKRCNKNNCATSASNVWVEIKVHFRSFKRLYFSHARWKLIEGSWNACDIFTEQDPARNRLKIMKRSRKNNCKHPAQYLSLSKGTFQEI